MQAADRGGAGDTELVAAVSQHPQRHRVIVRPHPQQIRGAQRHHRDRVGASGVGLAALPGGEHPRPRGQLRRHIHHNLAVGNQPLGQVLTDPVAALHRPHPIREPATDGEHVPITGRVGGEPSLTENTFGAVKRLDGGGPLLRIHANNNRSQIFLSSSPRPGQRGGQRYVEPGRPLLSHNLAQYSARTHAKREPHATPWAAEKRASRRAPRPSLARHRPYRQSEVAEQRMLLSTAVRLRTWLCVSSRRP